MTLRCRMICQSKLVIRLPSDGRGKWNTLSSQVQQHLSCAAEFAEPREDEADHLLHAAIRIEIETGVAMPDVAERHPDPQFAPLRL
jgi:hypothetical protein